MIELLNIQVKISERLYLKDPDTTKLGKKIVAHSITMIDEMGFEQFTFKKLAEEIQSTEASVYRYFENKHKLLIYLISWYWSYMSYRLAFETHRMESSVEKLKVAIGLFCHTLGSLSRFQNKDLDALYRIVVNESPKAYLTKGVDEDNKEGSFRSYKRFCGEVAKIVREVNPDYPFATALISTAVESAHHQKYFSEHLPSLTEVSNGDANQITTYLTDLIIRVISANGKVRTSLPEHEKHAD